MLCEKTKEITIGTNGSRYLPTAFNSALLLYWWRFLLGILLPLAGGFLHALKIASESPSAALRED